MSGPNGSNNDVDLGELWFLHYCYPSRNKINIFYVIYYNRNLLFFFFLKDYPETCQSKYNSKLLTVRAHIYTSTHFFQFLKQFTIVNGTTSDGW